MDEYNQMVSDIQTALAKAQRRRQAMDNHKQMVSDIMDNLPGGEWHDLPNGLFCISFGSSTYLGDDVERTHAAVKVMASIEAELELVLGRPVYTAHQESLMMYFCPEQTNAEIMFYIYPSLYFPRVDVHLDDGLSCTMRVRGEDSLGRMFDMLTAIYEEERNK